MTIAQKTLVLMLIGALACSSHSNKSDGPVAAQDAALSADPTDGASMGGAGAGGGNAVDAAGTIPDASGGAGAGGANALDAAGTIPSTGGSEGKADAEATTSDALAGGGTIARGDAGQGGAGGQASTGFSERDAGGGDGVDAASRSVCGDGVVSVGEQCDDGNLTPLDGCSPLCRSETVCTTSGCTSKCGDGLVLGEDCDDGNTVDGDGCSSACRVEPGWTCAQPPLGDRMMVPAVYRDFRYHTPADFQAQSKGAGSRVATLGMVKDDLDSAGKPVSTGLTGKDVQVESTSSFAQWYRDVSEVNHTTTGPLALWKTAEGLFVNRYGPNGEKWNATEKAFYCGEVGQEKLDGDGKPIPCTSKTEGTYPTECTSRNAKGMEMLKCSISDRIYQAIYITKKLDGQPLWFPVDGDTAITPKSEFDYAKIPPIYETGDETNMNGTWPYDLDESGKQVLHNFSFTSEFRSLFKYEAAKAVTLEFISDEDLWVFINKKLVLDLGGIHMPVKGSVTLDTTAAAKLGLVEGQAYEIAVFQAERQSDGSTLKIMLPGFNTAASVCTKL